MKIEYRYSVVYDLVYHILAHMKVENASNLYSEAYVDQVNQAKNNRYDHITDAVSHLSEYYNENFDRLGVINFLPFDCSSVQNLVSVMENHHGFTETDREKFVFPFSRLLLHEFAFYEDYWNKRHEQAFESRKALESWISKEIAKYEALFSYFGKSAVVGMSYSLSNNGRGYGGASSLNAIVPFAYEEQKYRDIFYQILHEYTHQFTDQLLGEAIRMDDGTHDISEKAVILFDYYLIKKMDDRNTDSYLKWFASLVNADICDENLFLSVMKVDDPIHEKLLELAEKIAEHEKNP